MSCISNARAGSPGLSVPDPELVDPTDALVRPFVAGRCDGDTVPLHRRVSRVLQLGIAVRAIDPVVACICGRVPFRGPFAIGHECVEAYGARTTKVVLTRDPIPSR